MESSLSLLLLLLLSSGVCSEKLCTNDQVHNCSSCIRAGPQCSWCQQLSFVKPGEQESVRCDTVENLRRRGCHSDDVVTVTNENHVTKDLPLSDRFTRDREPIQLSPQEIHVRVRPGSPAQFPVRFKRVQGYPVDLYYLMDLSFSMNDDLQNVKNLGTQLFSALQDITENGQIGFGAFVDKPVLPFTNTNPQKLEKPCDDAHTQCQPAFGYRHVLSLTSRKDRFSAEVQKQHISGNLDSPEGSLDAMMQATVCGEQIGWRNSSTRLLVLTTDAGFHMAGDGRLAGILEPNDETCHLGPPENLYGATSLKDYPSVGQLALQLRKQNIQPIFAVTENVHDIYKDLSKMIPKSEVGILSSNSDNVVKLITDAYNRLSSKVTLVPDSVPENVRVTFSPKCEKPGASGDTSGVCDDVRQETEIQFEVQVESSSCVAAPQSFSISPLGIKESLRVTVETVCDCSCQSDQQGPQRDYCNHQGELQCGTCRCDEGFGGSWCNCSLDKDTNTVPCKGVNGLVCEGRGDCVCGSCKCHKKPSGQSYRGEFCQCDDEQCDYHLNQLCAGRGRCDCGRCVCDAGFEGEACQCVKSREGCTRDGVVCSGRGSCKCNKCECDPGYLPPLCQVCPSCTEPCHAQLSCVECLVFNSGPLVSSCGTTCSSLVVQKVEALGGRHCELKDSEGCWVRYRLLQETGRNNYSAQVLQHRDCPPSLVAIVGASVASVALVGLLLLLLVKLLLYMKDLKEFRKFENEKKKSRWAQADNPLFKNATTTVTNPTFTGE